ncbi:MAG: 23S rRNA (adenine(2503)-C(2))-methyltransferase RlmN [Petrotogaceae bacterium]|jgi:23S rRNA (adenine2503-C2)-methyltransferase|nr:23S rRNA (adenine(2503)-C(2))-methyltransferase RlmN [Petrotogaceae bacterium]
MTKKNILDFEYEELEIFLKNELNIEKFRTKQVADWIYKKHVFTFSEMTNLSQQVKDKLEERLYIGIPEIVDMQVSKVDGTIKFLLQFMDGAKVESVIMYYANRVSACISSQVGCPLKCSFCWTGKGGFTRNLTSGEIVSQVLAMEKAKDLNINNIVFMGMGEPLLNYDNTMKSIRIMNEENYRNIGARHITISTSGIADKIEELGDVKLDIRLSLSLHASNNQKRDRIMPVNSKYPVEEVMQACRNYQKKTKNRVTIEYTLIRNFNETKEDAIELATLLEGLKVMINLIPVNPNPKGYERPSRPFMIKFAEELRNKGFEVSLRAERGTDIDAACGQLRKRNIERTEVRDEKRNS